MSGSLSTLLIGRTFGEYTIERFIGEGGMASVFYASHRTMNRPVALKFLNPALSNTEDIRKRFEREARTQSTLSHPNIVGIYDYREQGGYTFIILEFIDGDPLDKVVREKADTLSVDYVVQLFGDVAEGMAYAHGRNVIHRDIKPSNILLDQEGTAKVSDFGIAKLQDELSLTKTHSKVGTVMYMSPEQVRNRRIDHRTDIYSAGVMLYELLSGQRLFGSDTTEYEAYEAILQEPLPRLTGPAAKLQEVVDRATEKDPDRRYQGFMAFYADLLRASDMPLGKHASHLPPKLEPLSSDATDAKPEQPAKKRRRGSVVAISAVATIVLVATGLITLLGLNQQSPSAAAQPAETVIAEELTGLQAYWEELLQQENLRTAIQFVMIQQQNKLLNAKELDELVLGSKGKEAETWTKVAEMLSLELTDDMLSSLAKQFPGEDERVENAPPPTPAVNYISRIEASGGMVTLHYQDGSSKPFDCKRADADHFNGISTPVRMQDDHWYMLFRDGNTRKLNSTIDNVQFTKYGEGLWVVLNKQKRANYIDRNGKLVFPTWFARAGKFTNGEASVKTLEGQDPCTKINRKGECLIPG